MRKFLTGLSATAIALACGASASSAQDSGTLDLNTAEGAVKAMRKVQCSLVDNEDVTYYWYGRAYSRRMGEKDRHIFNVEGMNVRACSTHVHPERGTGYKLVTREILLYKDPKTNEVLKTWDNPWTGETVDVLHVANDPVNSSGYEIGRDGKPTKFAGDILGDRWQMSFTVPLFYPNPLASEYQSEIGGVYHATEMFNFFGDLADLKDASQNTANNAVGWARMSDWLPWMKMQGRDGIIYMHTAGRKLKSWNDMSETMKSEIRTHYPEYTTSPPPGDPRENVTSWKYYKSVKTGEVEPPKR